MKKYLDFIKNHRILIYSILLGGFLFFAINKFYINKIEEKNIKMLTERENLIKQKNELLNLIASLKKENEALEKENITLKDILLFKTKILDMKNKAIFFNHISNFNGILLESIVPGNIDKSSPNLFKWTINISIRGSYREIKNYIDYLNKLPYLIIINRLEMSKNPQKPINSAQITLEVLCR
ncbi:MAG: hypothetical protein N2202_02980 [Proteobacteria bacterium]|nr:hypothetical protein [Pseudomonadota bacterium]